MFKDTVIALGIRISGIALWMVFTILLARFTDELLFSNFMLLVVFSQFAAVICAFGSNMFVLKYAPKLWAQSNLRKLNVIYQNSVITVFLGGCLLYTLLLFSKKIHLDWYFNSSLLIITLTTMICTLTSLMVINLDFLRSIDAIYRAQVGFSIIRSGTCLLTFILFWTFLDLNIELLMSVLLLALAVAVIYETRCINQKIELKISGGNTFLSQIGSSIKFMQSEISFIVLNRVTPLILGILLDPITLAIFLASDRVASLMQILIDGVHAAEASKISLRAHEGGKALSSAVARASFLMVFMGIFGCGILIVFGTNILRWYGETYIDGYSFIVFFALNQLVWVVLGPTPMIANFVGLATFRGNISTIIVIIMIFAQILVYSRCGIWSVLYIYGISIWALHVALWYKIYKTQKVRSGLLGLNLSDLFQYSKEELVIMRKVIFK